MATIRRRKFKFKVSYTCQVRRKGFRTIIKSFDTRKQAQKWARVLNAKYTGGGGGFEPPLERDPKSVLYDVINKYVTIERAKEDYGVIINNKFEINNEETLKLRNQKNS